MASSSTRVRRYHVFPSFHGPDLRRKFLSHLHNLFASKGVTVFKDQEIIRGQTIRPELQQAIRESRISIVVLSRNFASSSWCLDELVEILECKEAWGQKVMTIFYDVDPSDVRIQSGDFGRAFEKTSGEHSLTWEDEAKMIEKIVVDVANKVNVIPSLDLKGMVGMEARLKKVNSYLHGERNEVKMIGIQGPAGIGKTTIARALFNQLYANFELKCFIDLKESYRSDGIGVKLCLQSQLLSKILNQKDVKINHLGAIKEWLQDHKVLIVLDDVDDLEQLDVLIIVTTEDRKILKAHWVNNIYHVDYPSEEEALEILCLSAFQKSSPMNGFEEISKKVANICGNLPLGLYVVGSSLLLIKKIEDVLKVGYDKLLKKDKSLFLHVAFFFNNEAVDHVTTMLAESNLDFRNGLKTLADKSLMRISSTGWIHMHSLLQQLERQVVQGQSNDSGKRQFLVDAQEIRDGIGSVVGISFDMSKISGEFFINGRAFEGIPSLHFLRIYGRYFGKDATLDMSGDMKYLPYLRPKCLIEIRIQFSKLEKLWGGIQPLSNLKNINLGYSKRLREIPNLSKVTNLEALTLKYCTSLVELPSSIWNVHKLKKLRMGDCRKLLLIPIKVDKSNSSQFVSDPTVSMNIKYLNVGNTKMEEIHPSIVERLPHLKWLRLGGRNINIITHVPESVRHLNLSSSLIETIPYCVIGLPQLESIFVYNCSRLMSLEGLPLSLKYIDASNCVSLERVCFSFNYLITHFMFRNCSNLDEE
ncbi:hypothetical protein N665_0477s0024 [Sinapis alba]|nr:hypothetical protein N665_0477s0024 [Sinapis alba]